MKRLMFNLLAGLSLLLCVATLALLLRSYSVCEIWSWSNGNDAPRVFGSGKFYGITSDHDELAFTYFKLEMSTQEQVEYGMWVRNRRWHFDHTRESNVDLSLSPSEFAPQAGWKHLGFGHQSYFETGESSAFAIRIILLPDWFAAIVFAVMPMLWMVSWRKRRRRTMTGRCGFCGYDLRATPECCPECGKIHKMA